MIIEENVPFIQVLNAIPESMAQKLQQQGSCEVNAVLIGSDINLRELTNIQTTRKEPVLTQLSETSVAMIFSYGAIVFFNATTSSSVELITRCQRFANNLLSTPETEQFTVIFQPEQPEGIVKNKISIKKFTKEHTEIIANALAKSTILEYHENRIGNLFNKIEPIAKNLEGRGRLGNRPHDMLKHIGASLLMAQEIVGKIEITEKPLLLWDHGELEPLYMQLIEDLEIIARQNSLERKIDLISDTAQISLDVLQQHHSHRLEWYIIILIAIEIVLQLYEIFFAHLI